MFGWLFKHNSSKTTRHTNIRHHLSPCKRNYHKEVDEDMVRTKLKVDFVKVAFFDGKK